MKIRGHAPSRITTPPWGGSHKPFNHGSPLATPPRAVLCSRDSGAILPWDFRALFGAKRCIFVSGQRLLPAFPSHSQHRARAALQPHAAVSPQKNPQFFPQISPQKIAPLHTPTMNLRLPSFPEEADADWSVGGDRTR